MSGEIRSDAIIAEDAWMETQKLNLSVSEQWFARMGFAAGFAAGVAHAEASARITIARLQDERDRANLRAELRDRFINGPMKRT